MDQEKVWDAVAENWAEFRNRPVDEVVEFLKDKKGKVLDLGCGSGRNFIESKDLDIHGVDFSFRLLEIAKEKGYVELKKGTTDEIPYGDEIFDWVVFVRVLHCVEGEEKRRKSLAEVYRVLKSGGEAVISTIGPQNQRVKNKPKEGDIPWTVNLPGSPGENVKYERYNYIYNKDEFEGQLKEAGFEVVSIEEDKNIVAVIRKPSS